MRHQFVGYYRPTPDEFDLLWNEASVVLDANALLNFYGYSQKTRRLFIDLLGRFEGRLWIPHQYAHEYQKNRHKAIVEQITNYVNARKKLEALIAQEFRSNKKHPYVSKKAVQSVVRLCEELKDGEAKHRKMLSSDEYHERISEIFAGRVGAKLPAEELANIYARGRDRYDKLVPPGYADKQKPDPERYGDLVGWMEILKNAKNVQKKHTLFVTDDAKPDWWAINKLDNGLIGPRPELVEEYRVATGDGLFYIYSAESFIRYAAKRFKVRVNSETLDELRAKEADTAVPSKTQASQLLLESLPVEPGASASEKPQV